MKFFWDETIERLAGWQPVRRLASAIALDRAGRHLVELDHADAVRCQLRHLSGLVHRARNTAFGRSHDFARIRTYDDYKRLVPLSTAADYAGLHTTGEDGRSASWPGPVLSWLQPEGSRFPVPVSRELLATFNQATSTALGHIMAARPRERLLSGRIVFLNDESTRLLQAALGHSHRALRAYVQGAADATPAELLAAPLTCLVGAPSSILHVLREARRLTTRESLRAIWPDLCAVVCIRSDSAFDSAAVRRFVADQSVLILDGWCDNASPVAIEDPLHNGLRLLTDHGVFWEFIPIESLTSEPERLSVGSIEVGGRYALAVSSPAGVWSCLLREQVVIESRTPVLIHVLESTPLTSTTRQKPSQPVRTSARRPLALLKTEP